MKTRILTILLFSTIVLATVLLSVHAKAQILLTTQNTINVRGEVTDQSMAKVRRRIFDLDQARGNGNYPIYLVMNTPGGSITAGEELIQYARSFRNLETVTIFAASMGAAIVEGIQGKRHILPNGTLMFHRATLGMQGQVSEGEFESRLAYYKTIILQVDARNASRLGLTVPQYKAKAKDEYWLYGMQALVDRAADDIVSISCTPQLVKRTSKETLNFGFFAIEVENSECPTL